MAQLEKSLIADNGSQESLQKQQRARLEQRLASVRQRFDRAYTDKLDGKISPEFWERKAVEWQAEEEKIQHQIKGLNQFVPSRIVERMGLSMIC